MNDYTQSNFDYKGFELSKHFKTTTTLFPHQNEAVEWMMYREEILFENVRGGMLLDQMGLGKTLSALSCAVLSGIGPTLIIVPAQLTYVWQTEIERHFTDIPYFVYHGPKRKKMFELFCLHHGNPSILIMSYQSIGSDIDDESGPLQNIKFHRIIYDECHYIKNKQTIAFKAIVRIQSDVKWFLSGTPIMNRIHEMYPYLKLLKFKKLHVIPQDALGRRGTSDRVSRNQYQVMQDLLKNIAIRRNKDVLVLPLKTYSNVYIDLNGIESEFYVTLREYSRARIRKFIQNLRFVRRSGILAADQNRLRIIIMQCMLTLILHLRLACCDPLLVIDKIPRTRDLDIINAIGELTRERDNDCPVCFNNDATVVNSQCGHRACSDCWDKLSKLDLMRCFVCMEDTDKKYLVHEGESRDLRNDHAGRVVHRSCKTRQILDLLKTELQKGNKVVVVSQWTSFLDILISAFKCENRDVEYIQLDGRTAPKKRQATVVTFQENDNIKVCFASLGSSAEGITLTTACSMIIADIFWNLAKLDQVSDRVHRIGQTKDVTIHMLYINDSIEMRLKDLVERKDKICKVIVDCMTITKDVQSWLSKIIKLID